MKKFLSVLLALVMVLSLSTVAFAAENEATFDTVVDDPETDEVTENEASFDVKTTVSVEESGAYADIVYELWMEWYYDNSTIDINNGELYQWDTEALKYVKKEGVKGLAPGENRSVDVTIMIKSYSNTDISYDIAYTDNALDNLTTTEDREKEHGSGKERTGTIPSADTHAGIATPAEDGLGHDYTIDENADGIRAMGEMQKIIYNSVVTVTEIADGAAMVDGAKLKLGTYTVTLGKVMPCKTVADLFATIAAEDFPDTNEKLWSSGGNSRLAIQADNMLIATKSAPRLEDYVLGTTVVTPVGNNYTCTSVRGATITFVMTNGKLTAIEVSNEPTEVTVGSDTYDFTPLNGTYTKAN